LKIDDTHPLRPLAAKPEVPSPEHKVAKEFEGIFLRKMLSSLEKTTSMTGKAPGAQMYGQMVTDALADAMGRGGGIGLADSLERVLGAETAKAEKK
jgi:Rod binding domain-containing protein